MSDWSSDVCSSDLAESRGTDRPGGRAEDREDQNDEDQIGDLERDPGGAEQPFEEAAIIIGPHLARKRKGQRGDDAPDEGREQHRGKPAPRARRHEIFGQRSEEHTSELQSLMRISYAVFCLKKKN